MMDEIDAWNQDEPVQESIQVDKTEINVTVSDPVKHEDHVSFLVSTVNTLKQTSFQVRRRFSDFVWLNSNLGNEYIYCIIPPLPSKHRKEYVTGDRFSQEFIEKRKVQLEKWLIRVCKHPILVNSPSLQKFFESESINTTDTSSIVENISDALMNTFGNLKKPDQRFTQTLKETNQLEQHLHSLEKSHFLLHQCYKNIQKETMEMGTCLNTFSQLEPQIQELANSSRLFSRDSECLSTRNKAEDVGLLSELHNSLGFCHSLKVTLKNRDNKQVEFEELSHYLDTYLSEREKLSVPYGSFGLGDFIKSRYNSMVGTDTETARIDRLHKVQDKIAQLQSAVAESMEISSKLTENVTQELTRHSEQKATEIQQFLLAYIDEQIQYHSEVISL